MAAITEPRSGIKYGWGLGFNGWHTEMDDNLKLVGRFGFHLSAKDKDLTAPPGALASGDTYIVAAGATGAWAGKDGQVALYDGSAWVFQVPRLGWRAFVEDEEKTYVRKAAGWAVSDGAGGGSYTVFGPSGSAHAAGLVPDPGAVAGSTKFLREDGTWSAPPSTTSNPGIANLLSESKPTGQSKSAKTEYATIAANGVSTLIDITGSGYIGNIFIAIDSSDFMARERAILKVYVDGETTPSISCTVANFFAGEYIGAYTNKSYAARYTGVQRSATNTISYYSFFPIPFGSSVKVTLTNASTTNSALTWSVIGYQSGIDNVWQYTRKLNVVEQRISNITPNAVVSLVDITGKKGRLLGVTMLMDANSSTWNHLEGNVVITRDGVDAYVASGTEDYFLNGFYFGGGELKTDYVGCYLKDATTYAIGAYRWHILDPQTFETSLKMTWQCGDTTQQALTTNTYLSYALFYYTE